MRFGGRSFGRQSFGASLRDLSLDKLGTSAREKRDREPVERQAPVFRGASKPEGRKLHRGRCNFRANFNAASEYPEDEADGCAWPLIILLALVFFVWRARVFW